jgi:hypothetical protein
MTLAIDTEAAVLAEHTATQPMRRREDLPGRHEVKRRSDPFGRFHQDVRIGMRGMIRRNEQAVSPGGRLLEMLEPFDRDVGKAVLSQGFPPAKRPPSTDPAGIETR